MWLLAAYMSGLIFVLFAGPGFTTHQELFVALALGTLLVAVSFVYRFHMHWRWTGIQRDHLSRRLLSIFGVAFVMIALLPGAPPDDPRFLPAYLCLAGGLMFNVLFFLGISPASKTQFLQQCWSAATGAASLTHLGRSIRPTQPVDSCPLPSKWKRFLRALYRTAYLIVCVIWVARFDLLAIAHRHGSPLPTTDQPAPVSDGHVVYLAHYQKVLLDHLPRIGINALFLLLLAGFLLNYFAGLNLYPTVRSRAQRLRDDRDDEPRLDLSNASK